MIGNRICAFALLAFILVCSAPPAIAAPYDGSWSMLVVTTSGHCGKIPVPLAIRGSRIVSTGGKFVFHRIHLVGRISPSGHARINAVAGPRAAQGIGRFDRYRGGGKWTGTGPSGVCSGFWTAVRTRGPF